LVHRRPSRVKSRAVVRQVKPGEFLHQDLVIKLAEEQDSNKTEKNAEKKEQTRQQQSKEENAGNSADQKENESSQKQTQEENQEDEKEKFLRLAAEFDNYKKRMVKELAATKELGKAELVRKLLPTLDEFELAIDAMPEGEARKGIELIYTNFMDVLKGEGLNTIEAKGQFDPYKHEIVMVKDGGEKDGTILEVVRKGYRIGEIILRPASVIVSKRQEGKNEANGK